MTVKRSPVTKWLTGRNVSTLHPEQGVVGDKGEKDTLPGVGGDADGDAPAESAVKAEWTDYWLAQGYTAEQLEGLTKADLIELDDEPPADDE